MWHPEQLPTSHIQAEPSAGVKLERKRSEILGLAWPERKAFVPAKARLWHTAAPGGFPKLCRGRQIKAPAMGGTGASHFHVAYSG